VTRRNPGTRCFARSPYACFARFLNAAGTSGKLPQGPALTTLCLQSFWATGAALSLVTLTDNLTLLFQRHLGWLQRRKRV